MKIKIILLILAFAVFHSVLYAQTIESWVQKNEKVPVEKIYIQTNKEFYFLDETIWFKIYLTDSRSEKLIPGAENVYINLIDDKGNRVIQSAVMSVNGQAPGSINLPEDFDAGNYLLEAYTDYLQNFTSDAFFYKPIRISRISGSGMSRNQQRFSRAERMVADVSMLPEGGKLLENTSNLVAFKALNRDGYGVAAKGRVIDETGNTVVEFSTDYKGMGLFFLTPEPGRRYRASINGFPSYKYEFDSVIAKKGVKIQVVNHTPNQLIVNIAGNSNNYNGEQFYLVNMHRGKVVFYQAFVIEQPNHVLKFNSENLKGGINRLVLLNKDLTPVSERLLFSNNYEVNNLQVNTDSTLYQTRSSVMLEIGDENDISAGEFSNLSVSVLHQDAVNEKGLSQNILSSLLIDSELNGFVESSADYFADTEISTRAKLRLLMLTNGWSSYFWNSVPAADNTLSFAQKAGIDLHGKAINVLNEKPIKNGEITLILEKDGEMAFLTKNTNDSGKFVFPGLLFNDTAKIYIQAKNKRGKMNTDIQLLPVFPEPKTSEKYVTGLNSFYSTPYELQRQKYYSDLAHREFDPNYRSLRINRVDVIEKKPNNDAHFRIYERPDQVVEVPIDQGSYGNVLDFMVGKAAGVDVTPEGVRIRGINSFGDQSMPLFLVDGVPLFSGGSSSVPPGFNQNQLNTSDQESNSETYTIQDNRDLLDMVRSIPLGDVDKVEILKSPENLVLFGSEGANGVIAIYTRKGKVANPNPIVKGMLERSIKGYTPYKRFYSPKYTPENRKNPAPDFRTTLYWDPEVSTQNGPAKLNFFTSDEVGRYLIYVEGITNKGIICIGNAMFEVAAEVEK